MERGKFIGVLSIVFILINIFVFTSAIHASSFTYSGTLSSQPGADGIINGTGNWVAPDHTTTLSWVVSFDSSISNLVHYKYILTHSKGETSHLIFEVSPDFTVLDILNPSGDFNINEVTIGTFDGNGNSNPGIPESIFGVKFPCAFGLTTRVEFDSTRLPVWGDFYAKDGQAGGLGFNAVWNAGFTSPDTDPTNPPSNGSVSDHVLVPNHSVTTAISLSSFKARQKGNKVIIKWETGTEIDNIGFNILHSEAESGEYVKINEKLIPARGNATKGTSYRFIDKSVKSGKTYYYKLEDIDMNGTKTLHGPQVCNN